MCYVLLNIKVLLCVTEYQCVVTCYSILIMIYIVFAVIEHAMYIIMFSDLWFSAISILHNEIGH